MSDREDEVKVGKGAGGGVRLTEEDEQLLKLMKEMRFNPPRTDRPEEMEHYMKYFFSEKDTGERSKKGFYIPKVSTFAEEGSKGDVTYHTWRYEVQCLLREGIYSEEQILHGIRKSCKGEAADILTWMEPNAQVRDILKKFDATYGVVDSGNTILRRLYACTQNGKESVTSYTARVEELFAQAVELRVMSPGQEDLLKSIVYDGLQTNLKLLINYKYETVRDYDRFKMKLRKAEMNLKEKSETEPSSKTKCQANTKVESNPEMTEMKDLLQKLNSRIEKLEKENEEMKSQTASYGQFYSYNARGRGSHGGRWNSNKGSTV